MRYRYWYSTCIVTSARTELSGIVLVSYSTGNIWPTMTRSSIFIHESGTDCRQTFTVIMALLSDMGIGLFIKSTATTYWHITQRSIRKVDHAITVINTRLLRCNIVFHRVKYCVFSRIKQKWEMYNGHPINHIYWSNDPPINQLCTNSTDSR